MKVIKKEVEDERECLYQEGYSDGCIARRQGLTTHGVAKWRRKKGYPANHSLGAPGIPKAELRAIYRSMA